MTLRPRWTIFETHLGYATADKIIEAVRDEIRNPFHFFDAIYCINLAEEAGRWQQAAARFARLGIASRVRRLEAIRTQPDHHIGSALSHRAVVAEAKALGMENVLVFEDDVILTSDAIAGLKDALDELRNRQWKLLYLGACRWNHDFPPLQGYRRLALAGAVTCTHAVAYHRSVYDRILSEVPGDMAGMERWLKTHLGIDQYYAFILTEDKYMLSPVIATQRSLVPMESSEVRQLLSD